MTTAPPVPDDRQTADPRYCPRCGTPVAGPYCAGCGEAISSVGEEPTAEFRAYRAYGGPPPNGPVNGGAAYTPERKPNRGVLIGLCATAGVLVVAAIVVGVVLLTSGSSSSSGSRYQAEVGRIFAPVLTSNQQVSDELGRLHGARATDARAAVRRVQREVTTAQGALGAVAVPAGSQSVSSAAHEVLDRETAYLTSVGGVLARPSAADASQLPTLASNLMSALSATGPAIAGTSQTVTNTDVLMRWVARAVHARHVRHHRTTTTPPSGGGGPANPLQNGRSCGGGLYAGPNTTCPFAQNVRDAYNEAPGATATVEVYSPVTGQTYTMDCAPSGTGVTCSGGNNASVSF